VKRLPSNTQALTVTAAKPNANKSRRPLGDRSRDEEGPPEAVLAADVTGSSSTLDACQLDARSKQSPKLTHAR
jgi:hypothetical protein